MFTFISIMAVGVLIGYPLRHKSQVRKITPLIHIVVCLLLFLLGLSIGLNRLIIDNLGYFCGQAAVISSLSTAWNTVPPGGEPMRTLHPTSTRYSRTM